MQRRQGDMIVNFVAAQIYMTSARTALLCIIKIDVCCLAAGLIDKLSASVGCGVFCGQRIICTIANSFHQEHMLRKSRGALLTVDLCTPPTDYED